MSNKHIFGLSAREMALRIGVDPSWFSSLLGSGRLPEPPIRVGKRCYFLASQEQEIKEALAKPKLREPESEQAIRLGLYSIGKAAEILGMPRGTIDRWLQDSKLPRPSKAWKGRRYYTSEDLDVLRALMQAHGYTRRK